MSLLLSLLPSLTWACVPAALAERSYAVTGEASSRSGELLYTETLTQTAGPEGGTLSVDYRDPNGDQIATKTAAYNCNPTTPSFELTDLESGTSEGVRWSEDSAECYVGDTLNTVDTPDGQAIVDAGFDNAIWLNWDALMQGKSVRFQYLFARKNRFVKLRLKKSKPPRFLRGEAGEDVVFFKIAANNFLFRLVSDSLYVGYDRETKSLRYYIGPSNLPSMSNVDTVVIRYQSNS